MLIVCSFFSRTRTQQVAALGARKPGRQAAMGESRSSAEQTSAKDRLGPGLTGKEAGPRRPRRRRWPFAEPASPTT